MKLHQQGNEIIVTELRPMSELREREFALCYGHVNLGRYGDLEKYQKLAEGRTESDARTRK